MTYANGPVALSVYSGFGETGEHRIGCGDGANPVEIGGCGPVLFRFKMRLRVRIFLTVCRSYRLLCGARFSRETGGEDSHCFGSCDIAGSWASVGQLRVLARLGSLGLRFLLQGVSQRQSLRRQLHRAR